MNIYQIIVAALCLISITIIVKELKVAEERQRSKIEQRLKEEKPKQRIEKFIDKLQYCGTIKTTLQLTDTKGQVEVTKGVLERGGPIYTIFRTDGLIIPGELTGEYELRTTLPGRILRIKILTIEEDEARNKQNAKEENNG